MFVLKTPETIAFEVFGVSIYWYGILMAIAIFTAILVSNVFFNCNNLKQYKDKIIEYAPWIIFSGILGARLYYCCLNFNYYLSNPVDILNIRQGGLSIHGAIIGGILCLYFVARKTKVSILRYLDAISTATILGQAIGRWGNYFNSEAYGLPVKSQQWGVLIPESRRLPEYMDLSLYHPTFLYESFLDVLGFVVLVYLYFKYSKTDGVGFFSYLVIYSVIRFFIERIRVDSAFNVGSIPIAEIVSIILFVAGIVGLVFVFTKRRLSKN